MALSIIDKYFSEDGAEEQTIAPKVSEQENVYEFSANANLPAGGYTF